MVINSGPWAIHFDAAIHGASGDLPSKGVARGLRARATGTWPSTLGSGASGDTPSKGVAWLAFGKAHRDQPSQGSVSTSVGLHLKRRDYEATIRRTAACQPA